MVSDHKPAFEKYTIRVGTPAIGVWRGDTPNADGCLGNRSPKWVHTPNYSAPWLLRRYPCNNRQSSKMIVVKKRRAVRLTISVINMVKKITDAVCGSLFLPRTFANVRSKG
jgi:hypothetical protein